MSDPGFGDDRLFWFAVGLSAIFWSRRVRRLGRSGTTSSSVPAIGALQATRARYFWRTSLFTLLSGRKEVRSDSSWVM